MSANGSRLQASVLIATRNRSAQLERTLEHLDRQHLPPSQWNVIVVDNGSSDKTSDVIRNAAQTLPLTALYEPKIGKSRALNRALAVATGDLVVFTDDDVIPESSWLSALCEASRRLTSYSIFGGRVIPTFPDGTRPWLPTHSWAQVWAFTHFDPPVPEGPLAATPCGPNFAVRATAMSGVQCDERVGPKGDNYAMGSETDLINRLIARGERCAFVPSATVSHVIAPDHVDLRWLKRRAFRAGRGKVRCGTRVDSAHTLFGAPRRLWWDVARSGLRYSLASVGNERQRFDAGVNFHLLRGKLHEHRLMARDRDR